MKTITADGLCGRATAPPEFAASLRSAMNPAYQYTSAYRNALATSLLGRSFFTTTTGFLGIGVPGIRRGDVITILFGAELPFVLRQNGEVCQMIGACYVSGMMDGKFVDYEYRSGLLLARKFVIQ
jgi:hypothetical protein